MPTHPLYTNYPGLQDDDGFQYQNSTAMAQSYMEKGWTFVNPAFRDMSEEYMDPYKAMLPVQIDQTSFYPSPTASLHMNQCTSPDRYFGYAQPEYQMSLDATCNSQYHSPTGPLGGSLSDASSEHTLSQESCRQPLAFSASPPASFTYSSIPGESPSTYTSMWPVSPQYTSLPTPAEETMPSLPAMEIKEAGFQFSRNVTFEHHQFFDGTVTSAKLSAPVQLLPEELELSESTPSLAFSSRTNTVSSKAIETSDDETMTPVQDNESDSDFTPNNKRRNSTRHSSAQNIHGRTNSSHSARSARGSSNNKIMLGPASRVQKQSSQRGSSFSYTTAKDKARSRHFSSKNSSPEATRADKQSKSFPCAFHLFGCTKRFGNKNEWKRHVYSQHLQLEFFRCDLGSCNPEYNPKLYVSPERGRRGIDSDGEREVIFNDFNRKDLFTQHCRRMHGPHRFALDTTTITNQNITARAQQQQSLTGHSGSPKSKLKVNITKEDEAAFEAELNVIRARCRLIRRKAPSRTSCGFCNRVFEVEASKSTDIEDDDQGKAEERVWEERMEHVGRHYERNGARAQDELLDDDLVEWGIKVGVLEYATDKYGSTRPWLAGREVRDITLDGDNAGDDADADFDSQQSPNGSSLDYKLEQRRKGLRHRRNTNQTESIRRSAPIGRQPTSTFSDSEEDALAEDE